MAIKIYFPSFAIRSCRSDSFEMFKLELLIGVLKLNKGFSLIEMLFPLWL